MFKCTKCDKSFEKIQSLNAHKGHCGKDPNKRMSKESRYRSTQALLTHDRKKSSSTKLARLKENGKFSEYFRNLSTAGLSGKKEESYKKQAATMRQKYSSGEYEPRKGIGRGKRGWYRGFWCDSSYELAWVIYNLDHSELFERNKDGFKYTWEGEIRTFFPDFKLPDGSYVEIKGWVDSKSIEKIRQFPEDLIIKVLLPKDLTEIFKFVEDKYGKNFISLYEAQVVERDTQKT